MSDGIADQPSGATPIDDTSGLLRDITTRGELDEAEALNIVSAVEWLESGRIGNVFSVQFYRKLHVQMFSQVWAWSGALRSQTGCQVGEPFVRAERVGEELGRVAMEFNRDWEALNDRGDDLLPFLARYHHALVWVHPFNNGNGRWSRLATDAVLQRMAGQAPLTWVSDAATLEIDSAERGDYIAALHAADGGEYQALRDYLRMLNPAR